MFGSTFIEIVIGLAFVYVLLSLVCTVLNEMIAQFANSRAETLKKGLERLLTDATIREKFYRHPLIKSLGKEPPAGEVVKPSYIPPRAFALALIDVIAPAGEKVGQGLDANDPNKKIPSYTAVQEFAEVRTMIARMDEGDMRTALLTLIDAAHDNLEQARKNIEAWFDSVMDRVSGWYKRRAQVILLVLAVIVTGAMNADTITLATSLWRNPVLRQGVVAAADSYIAASDNLEDREKALGKLQQRLEKLGLPLGWSTETLPIGFWQWLSKVVGLLFTVFAVSLGAPFWFDLLNKFVRLRGSGKVPEKSTG